MEVENKLTAFLLGILAGQFMGCVLSMLGTVFMNSIVQRRLDDVRMKPDTSDDSGTQ